MTEDTNMTQKEKDYVENIRNTAESESEEVVLEKLTKDEREIVLLYNEAEGVWYADTSIPKYWRKLEKKNWICIKTQYYKDGTICSKTFKGSKKGVSIIDPFKKREMSDEQKEAVRQRFLNRTEDKTDGVE